MKRLLILILIVFLKGSSVYGQFRIIKGQLLNTNLMLTGLYLKIDSLDIELYDIGDSIDYSHISSDGNFIFKTDLSKFNFVFINFSQTTELRIVNIPQDSDTVNLGKIDLIKHKEISVKEYNEIKQSLILKNENGLLKQDYESYLSKKYIPLRDGICGYLYGYKCADELERYQMTNPWVDGTKIQIDFNSYKDLITIDYSKVKNTTR